MKHIIKATFAVLFTMLFFPTSVYAQSKGLDSASHEVWKNIESFEINKLPANDSLVCLNESDDSVLVGVLLRDGDYEKYYKNATVINANVWMFIPDEIYDKYGKRYSTSTRFCQFLGLDTIQKRDTVVIFNIARDSLFRPAYNTSPYEKVISIPDSMRTCDSSDSTIKEWVTTQMKTNTYPWTRMGYTYDWGTKEGNHFGATEFVCRKGSKISNVGYMTLGNFLKKVKQK